MQCFEPKMLTDSNNYTYSILEEIALEGLDGITIDALWSRLIERPGFPIQPTEDITKNFLWRAVTSLVSIEFYLLPEPRRKLIIFNRFESVDENGDYVEPEELLENLIYPHCPIEDNGIMGSCSTYKKRKNITEEVKGKSLEYVSQRWGEALVIVADQETRKSVLFNSHYNPSSELCLLPYCFLERIGRSRYQGETTLGKSGLQTISDDPKVVFYHRKSLKTKKLITKQKYHTKVGKCKTNSFGSLLHLPRFSSTLKTKHKSDSEKLMDYIRRQPQQFAVYKDVQKELNLFVELNRLMKREELVKSEMVPYRVVYPNAPPSEWKIKSSGFEKSVRIIKIVETPDAGEDEDDDEDEDEESGLLDDSHRVLDRTLLRQSYTVLEKAGEYGLSQTSISSLVAVPSLQCRSICRHLVRKNLCSTLAVDMGRHRTGYYFSKKFESNKSSLSAEVREQKNKLLQIISHSNSNSSCEEVAAVKTECEPQDDSRRKDSLEIVLSSQQTPAGESSTHVQPTEEDLNSIETEIIVSKSSSLSEKSFPSLTEEVKSFEGSSTTNSLTLRILKRATLIMQTVNAQKVIIDPQKLLRVISEEEESEGFHYTIDRKTVLRLIEKLEEDGHVKTIRVNLKGFGREKNMMFICHPSVDPSHSEIQSAIEQAKMKLPIITRENLKKKSNRAYDPVLGPLPISLKEATCKYDQKAGKKYGYKPKFVRMQILHMYMYYLIYGYSGKLDLDQSTKSAFLKKHNLEESFAEEMSAVYTQNCDWTMFLPPLPVHNDYGEGWCLMSDLLLRLPLCLFVGIVNVPYQIPTLQEYIDHPIRRYYLVKHLPPEIVNHLTIMRKYIFIVSDLVTRLGYIGLVQMGPQRLKEKDQVFVYLNRKACLLDTTPSSLGYNHISKDINYERVKYTFSSIHDVDQYWCDLWNYAMHTNLGCRNVMTGQPIVIEAVNTKKSLVEAIQPRTVAEAKKADIGYIPGDQLGAGGLDSDMFVHLKRNWYWTTDTKVDSNSPGQKDILYPPGMSQTPNKRFGRKRLTESSTKTPSKEIGTDPTSHPETRSGKPVTEVNVKLGESSKTESQTDASKIKGTKESWKSRVKPKIVTRIVKPKRTRYGRKPYYDQVDREALTRMVKLRVDWTPAEDNLLLICKVASLYMCPDKRRHVLKNFCAVREILHTTFPDTSRNKTSRACQRRMHYMMKNPSTVNSVYLCLEEIKQDEEIVIKFDKAVENLDAGLKAQGKGPKGFQEEYDKIFIDLVTHLMLKLKTVARTEKTSLDSLVIPNTIKELYSTFKVTVPQNLAEQSVTFHEVQNTVDIMCSVVNTVIHSSLCCSNEKVNFSYQLFHIYQQYPDKLLRSVMAKCRSMSIVSCRRRYKRWKTANHGCLPLSSSPYQLSISYVNILQARYQYPIFSQCYEGLKNVIERLDENERNNILSVESTESTIKNEMITEVSSEQNEIGVELEVNNGGECANIVELYSAGFVKMFITFPEHLIILDPRLSENEENYSQVMERFKELMSVIRDSRKKESQKSNTLSKGEDEDDFEDEDDGVDEQGNALSSNKDPEVEDFFCSSGNKLNLAAKAASRLAVYMMRDEPLESLDRSLQHAHDYFVLNPCKVNIKLETKEDAVSTIVDKKKNDKIISELKRLANFPQEHLENTEIVTLVKDSIPNEQLLIHFLEFLEGKKELGATYQEIEACVGASTEVNEILDVLTNHQFILKSGLVNVRIVHNKFTKPWLIRSYYIPRLVRETMQSSTARAIAFTTDHDMVPGKRMKFSSGSLKKETSHSIHNPEDHEMDHEPMEEEQMQLYCIDNDEKSEKDSRIEDLNCDAIPSSTSNDCSQSQSTEIGSSEQSTKPTKDYQSNASLNNDNEAAESNAQPSKGGETEHELGKVLIKKRKRKWVQLSKANMEQFNELDYSSMKSVHVVVRPWIKIDGNLNRRVLDRLLGSVLGHCLSVPGLSVTKLQKRFMPALQPVHTFELIEILRDIGCVHLFAINTVIKPSLFSQRSVSTLVPATGFEKSCQTLIEPDLLAISKFGQFIGKKAYSIDYLDTLTDAKLLAQERR